MEITFDISAGWQPDLIEEMIWQSKALADARNLEAYNGSYWPVNGFSKMESPVVISGAGEAKYGIRIRLTDSSTYMCIGSVCKSSAASGRGSLYIVGGASAYNVTNTASGYTASGYVGGNWDFEQYGNWVIATDGSAPPQVIKTISATPGKFADLGNIPTGFTAKYVIFNNGHLFFGNYHTTADGDVKQGVIWSAYENLDGANAYVPSLATGASTELFSELNGPITGLINVNNKPIILAERSIVIGQFIGGTYTFSFVRNPFPGIGCYYPNTLIGTGNVCFFWGDSTIWMFDGLSVPKDIGNGVRKTLFDMLQSGHENDMSAAIDGHKNTVYWLIPYSYDATSGRTLKKIVAYNYVENRWTYIEEPNSLYCNTMFAGYNPYQGLSIGDRLADDIATTADSMGNYYVDTYSWGGGSELPAIVMGNEYAGTGGWDIYFFKNATSPLQATVRTGGAQQQPAVFTALRIRPGVNATPTQIDNATAKHCHIGTRMTELEPYDESGPHDIQPDGYSYPRVSGKQMYLTLNIDKFSQLSPKMVIEAEVTGGR